MKGEFNMNEIMNNNSIFESIKHVDEIGNEYWLARELQKALGYKEWRKFERVITKS
jgi:DNA-damage-inducible protein D